MSISVKNNDIELKGGEALKHVFGQKATPQDIHILNHHQILSIVDILEYLISKNIFWSLTS